VSILHRNPPILSSMSFSRSTCTVPHAAHGSCAVSFIFFKFLVSSVWIIIGITDCDSATHTSSPTSVVHIPLSTFLPQKRPQLGAPVWDFRIPCGVFKTVFLIIDLTPCPNAWVFNPMILSTPMISRVLSCHIFHGPQYARINSRKHK
jgi:hypothetical protein